MAAETFSATGEPPGHVALPAWSGSVSHGENIVRALGRHKVSLGLGLVPTEGIGVPALAVEMQQLRLDAAGAGGLATLQLQRECARKNGIRREIPHLAGDDSASIGSHDD